MWAQWLLILSVLAVFLSLHAVREAVLYWARRMSAASFFFHMKSLPVADIQLWYRYINYNILNILAMKIYNEDKIRREVQGVARNVIPLIVHITYFYYYKNI